jgi:hypothetical protein
MIKIIEKTLDLTTGEETIIERDETAAETKARLDYAQEVEAEQAEAQAKATEKAALLAKLGITEEEAALLLGGN